MPQREAKWIATVNLERSHLIEGVVDSRIVTVEVINCSIRRYSDSKAERLGRPAGSDLGEKVVEACTNDLHVGIVIQDLTGARPQESTREGR